MTQSDGQSEAPEQVPEPAPARQPRRLTGYLQNTLNARRMRDATVEERLAALRSVREEANRGEQDVEEADVQRRRNRLSTRLRERFRIGTRPHEGSPA